MTWYHPKYYAALRAERKKLQAASAKHQASSDKQQEPRPERPKEPRSKHLASSVNHQANINNPE